MRLSPLLLQILMYLIVGGLSSCIDVGGFWLLLRLGTPVMASTIVSFAAAALTNYVLSYTLAFARGRYSRSVEVVRFILVSLAALTVNASTVWILTQSFAVPPIQAKVVAVLVVLGWNFIARRLFVFHKDVPDAIAAAFGAREADGKEQAASVSGKSTLDTTPT